MSALDNERARELLVRIVQKYYAERHSPLPGTFVKAQMLVEAQRNGSVFSERELGFRKFIDFIRTVPEVAIQGRSGTDILLAPVTATELLSAYAAALPSLRRDFWRAFIEFPIENTVRLYDPEEDKIVQVEADLQRPGILIEPVPPTTQLEWRRKFSEVQPETIRDNLLVALEAPATAFNEFARRLRENPAVARAWHRYLQKQVTDHALRWAEAHGIPPERWLASDPHAIQFFRGDGEALSAKPQNISERAELYNFFDQLPIEDLLQLRVPLEWVLKITRRGVA